MPRPDFLNFVKIVMLFGRVLFSIFGDIAIFLNDWEVISRIREADLKVKIAKFKFRGKNGPICGTYSRRGSMKTSGSKNPAITELPAPKTKQKSEDA